MPRNVKGCARLGRCNLGCPIDAKQSALVSYVPRAERAGARVLPDAPVQRIRVESGAVVGVEALRLDARTRRPVGPLTVESRLVCVAAGVLGSAALLLRSGIGRSAPGEGLQVHSTVHVAARFAEPVHAYLGPTMAYAVTEWSDVNGRRGPGFMLENVPAHPLVTASALPGFGDEPARAMDALPHLARCAVLVRDRTRGRVRVDGAGRPRFEYALEAGDLERLRAGMQAAAELYLAAGAEEVWLPLNGSPPVRSEADLRHLASWPIDPSRLSFLYAVHLFGGAAMDGSASGVCDPEGACRGIRGLYVSDAAALPGNTGVNPQVTVVANALRIGAGIAARAGA
jgi:choline dehydrogenase-like flavoprotein